MTAVREVSPLRHPMQPTLLCAYEVDAEPVFDALDMSQRKAFGVTDEDLVCPNWEREMLDGTIPASQKVGGSANCSRICRHAHVQFCARHGAERSKSRVMALE